MSFLEKVWKYVLHTSLIQPPMFQGYERKSCGIYRVITISPSAIFRIIWWGGFSHGFVHAHFFFSTILAVAYTRKWAEPVSPDIGPLSITARRELTRIVYPTFPISCTFEGACPGGIVKAFVEYGCQCLRLASSSHSHVLGGVAKRESLVSSLLNCVKALTNHFSLC